MNYGNLIKEKIKMKLRKLINESLAEGNNPSKVEINGLKNKLEAEGIPLDLTIKLGRGIGYYLMARHNKVIYYIYLNDDKDNKDIEVTIEGVPGKTGDSTRILKIKDLQIFIQQVDYYIDLYNKTERAYASFM